MSSIRSCGVGSTTTSGPTSERSSTGSTAGSCGAFGRIGSSAGDVAAGCSCRKRSLNEALRAVSVA